MKYLFSLLLLFVSLSVFAQEPPYTPMRLNYQFRGIRVDSLFLIPNYVDTSAANGSLSKRIAGSFIRTGNDFWMRNSDTSAWLQNVNVGSGASPTLNFVNNVFKKSGTDSVFYVVAPADTFFSFKDLGVDTTSLSNRIDLKVDSLKRSNDSVYFKRSGVWSFGYKDSLGQPVNFANTNLSATGNRTHNFKNYKLSIDSISDFDIKSKNISRFSNLRLLNGNYTLFSYNNSNGNTTSIESLSDSLQVGGYDGALNFYGNVTNLSNGTVSLKRGNNRALLSMRDFGTDTIALKSDITGGGADSSFVNMSITGTSGDGYIAFSHSGTTPTVPSGKSFLFADFIGDLNWKSSYGYWNTFSSSANTADRIYTLPNNTGTIALTSDIGRKVDTIYRTAGKDSIFFKIAGTTYKIKDSTGGGGTDSPDRIDGTATSRVDADMGNYTFKLFGDNTNTASIQDFSDIGLLASDSIRIEKGNVKHLTTGNKYEFKDFNNTFLRIDTLGNFEAGDLTKDSLTFSLLRSSNEILVKSKATPVWKEQNNGITTYFKVGRGVNSISLASANYSSRVPGVYVIATGGANDFVLPDADDWAGQSVTVINTDGGNSGGISAGVGTIYDRGTGNTISSIAAQEMIIFYSDGYDWYGAIQ